MHSISWFGLIQTFLSEREALREEKEKMKQRVREDLNEWVVRNFIWMMCVF